MAAVSSPLGLCSLCRDATSRAFLERKEGVSVQQTREDFLNAQHKCYICTWIVSGPTSKAPWIVYGLTSEELDSLPQKFDIIFEFFSSDRQYERISLVIRLPGYGIDSALRGIQFFADSDTEFTSCFPPAVANYANLHLRTLTKHWIEECRQNHANCTPIKDVFRPKRLINIIDRNHWKLVHPRHLPRESEIDYVALSYCWGGSTQLLRLVKDNECQLQGRMRVENLPTTFKEAISACVELKYQYLWIDSLCIIQDNPADWQEQAAEMNMVYEKAVLSLCMAGSATPSEASFLLRNTDLMLPLSLTVTGQDGKERALHMVCENMFDVDVTCCRLRNRGWVFQEWFLAKRSLIFGSMQLWWHCCEEVACETIPGGMSGTDIFMPFKKETEAMKNRHLRRLKDQSHFQQYWWGLVGQFADTELTEETKDRVIAFSGISRALGKLQNIEDQYVAGMWRCHLPQSLLWFRFKIAETYRSLAGYKAPSWSWMSVDGPASLGINFGQESQTSQNRYCCSFEDVCLSLVDKGNITGRLQGGFIHIRGHLLGLRNEGVDENDIERNSSLSDFGPTFNLAKVIKWDEMDDNGDVIVSYLDNITVEACQEGIPTVFSRTRVPLEHAKGSFFALPVLHGVDSFGLCTSWKVTGLVLYQPPHQTDFFHRVAFYRDSDRPGLVGISDKLDFASFTERLSQYPARSIYIF